MADAVENARQKREKALTAEQEERREVVRQRQAAIAGGAKRGPNAPADKTFGGVKKGPKS